MKKVYDFRTLISFNNKDWYDTSYRHHLTYCSEEDAEEGKEEVFEVGTFEDALEVANILPNTKIEETWLTKKPMIEIFVCASFENPRITKKNFKSFYVKFESVEYKSCSFNFLSEHLPGDDFCEWLKDRGMTNYIDNK